MIRTADIIIIGSGVAALQLARQLPADKNVIIITKSSLGHGNSRLAQGGIAAAIGDSDHPFYHFIDSVIAGQSMNNHQATLMMTEEAPQIIRELETDGCAFDYEEQGILALGKEGAHTQNRIIHGGGDQTGKVLMDYLIQSLPQHVEIFENHYVFELMTSEEGCCFGVKSKDASGIHEFHAPHTVLATGGCGQLYASTSNAPSVTGDGMALAYQAGAELADMEFIQFHPTLLYIQEKPVGLISEAVRGEGAVLVDKNGTPIMENIHPLKDLAPRHVVSQTIYQKRKNGDDIYLDIGGMEGFQKRFPHITNLCRQYGVDLHRGQIPVAPGCHFSMGGVKTDMAGRSTVKGLYAIGEVACTGVHGANRLASNSLLEGLVYGKRLAKHLQNDSDPFFQAKETTKKRPPLPFKLPSKTEIQERMMENVGIMRDGQKLSNHLQWLESFARPSKWRTYDISMLTFEQMTRMFMLQTCWLITYSALEREESRGSHYRSDFPEEQLEWQNKQIIRQRTLEMREVHESMET
ncbi:L-aspartate oxidase [Halobacillus sp. GSS1]|uniref:L-aspartate oxidase n=1 Tax=Halobacillus sp. GSS1 TaxID=2815919 RepID=UPI001A8CA4D5|nr:L-aspartate oxidase [Halobacillus sp. GSS1]MBN9655569.1 L-aspartate oxidase [Halobacillus sp. GSS1]